MLKRPLMIIALMAGAALLPLASAPFGGMTATAAEKHYSASRAVSKPLSDAQTLEKAGDLAGALAKAKEADAISKKTPYDQLVIDEIMGKLYVEMKDYPNAIVRLNSALQSPVLSSHDKLAIDEMIGNAYATTKDYKNALAHFKAAVASPDLPPQDKPGLQKAIVTLEYALGESDKAMADADQYMKDNGADADILAMQANIYLDKKNYQKAYSIVTSLLAKTDANGTKPERSWLQLLLYSASGLNKHDDVRNALYRLVKDYPSSKYWHDYIGELQHLPHASNIFILNGYRLMYAAKAFLSGSEYLNAAQAAVNTSYPAEAETYINAGKAAGMIGPGKNQAQDRKLAANAAGQAAADKPRLASYAAKAKAAASGSNDIDIGELYFSYGEADKAVDLIKAGMAKGKLKDPDAAHIALGRIYLETGKIDEARAQFTAVKSGTNDVELAKAWLLLCDEKAPPAAASGSQAAGAPAQ